MGEDPSIKLLRNRIHKLREREQREHRQYIRDIAGSDSGTPNEEETEQLSLPEGDSHGTNYKLGGGMFE